MPRITVSQPMPSSDFITKGLVALLRLLKFSRKKPVPIKKMRAQVSRRDQKTKLKLPPNITAKSLQKAGINCSYLQNQEAPADKYILQLHGGAMCMRMERQEMNMIAPYAKAIKANVLLPHYRLSPEHQFPAGLDDCISIYRQLLDEGVKPEKIVLLGLSAGGGYSLALLATCKQLNWPMPSCAILLSPSGDSLGVSPSIYENNRKDPLFFGSDINYYQNLLCRPEQISDRRLNISLMESFDAYPPMYLSAGEGEVLRDVAVMAAHKAEESKIPYQLDIFPGGFHGVHATRTKQSKALWQRIEAFTLRYQSSA